MTAVRAAIVELYVYRTTPAGREFLLLKRARGDYLGGTWQPVGGGIEPDEHAIDAAQRELSEEAGVTPRRMWQANSVFPFYVAMLDCVICPICFLIEIASDEEITLSAEHTAARWTPEPDFSRQLMWPAQRAAFAELQQTVLDDGPLRDWLAVRHTPARDADQM